MRWQDYVECKPGVMLGKPVIKGTRLTVEHIVGRLGEGWTEQQLLESYPQLRVEHIRAALQYASHALAGDETIFLSESA